MEAQNKKSAITWGSYVSILVAYISAWSSGALNFLDSSSSYWSLTPLQVVFVPLVGIGVGLAVGEGVSRVKAGSSISEYIKAGTEEVEKFLQAGLGTNEGAAKRITGQWTSKAGATFNKLKSSITDAFNRVLRRAERNVNPVARGESEDLFPSPKEMLAGFWQAMNKIFATTPVAKVRAASVLAGRAGEVTLYSISEYDPRNVQSKEVYLKGRTKMLISFAVLIAVAFATLALLKVFGVIQ